MAIPMMVWPKDSSEVISYLFDYSNFPEVLAGETLSSPTVTATVGSGLTIGTPNVTLVERDEVAAGEGVEVTISSGTAGTTYTLECRCTTSGGSQRVVKGQLVVE